MKCSAARKLVYRHLDGELDSRLEDQFQQHLQDCEKCHREHQEVSSDHRLLSGSVVPLPVSPDFVPGVMARIRAGETWKSQGVYHLVLNRRAAHIAVAVVLAGVVAVGLWVRPRKRTQPVEETPTIRREPPMLKGGPTGGRGLTAGAQTLRTRESAVSNPEPPQTATTKTRKPPQPLRTPRPKVVPPSNAAPLVAHVLSRWGTIRIRPGSSTAWGSSPSGGRIHLGDLLQTKQQVVRVATHRGDRLWLNRSTVVQFRKKEIALFRGELFVAAQHSSRGLMIRTPGTTTTVHGTRFNVRLSGDAVRVTVVEGKVKVGTSGGTALLSASQQVTATPGAPPTTPQVVDVQPVIAWTGIQAQPRSGKPEATPLPEPPANLQGVTFSVQPEAEAGVFQTTDASLSFAASVEYAATAPRSLRLRVTVKDAQGKVALDREDTLADEQSRYRVKKVVLDRLPPGEFVGEFKLVAGKAEITRAVRFSVR